MDSNIEVADAIGKATAAVCIQAALVRLLLRKRLIAPADVATLAGEAETALGLMAGLSAEAIELAQASLRGFSQAWTKAVTTN
jgi:hypothetical protein